MICHNGQKRWQAKANARLASWLKRGKLGQLAKLISKGIVFQPET